MKIKTQALSLPNIPWEERPSGCNDAIWRYSGNPIIPRNAVSCANSIFNSAVVPYQGKYAGVFRVDTRARSQCLHAGFSEDGIRWQINETQIDFVTSDGRTQNIKGYDPRVCWVEDRFYIQWCNEYFGPTIGLAWTKDFETFHQLENAFLVPNRNGVLFPRKINGQYLMLSRPSDMGHTPFGNIFLSHSRDLEYWGKHRMVMLAGGSGWQGKKIGAGPTPIETSEGWLMIYHGVLNSCNGFVYSFGAALLDLDQPWKVLARSRQYLLAPWMDYECVGDVPNVTFPCAALVDGDTNRIAIYYGCADTVTGLCFGFVDQIIDFIRSDSIV